MKNVMLIVAMITVAVVFADAAMPQTSACKSCCQAQGCKAAKNKYIGKEAAIAVALAHAGLARNAVRDLKCELDRENGVMVYEVEFESGLFDYEYDIDAVTGRILKSKKELD